MVEAAVVVAKVNAATVNNHDALVTGMAEGLAACVDGLDRVRVCAAETATGSHSR